MKSMNEEFADAGHIVHDEQCWNGLTLPHRSLLRERLADQGA